MARPDRDVRVVPSVLDRLVGDRAAIERLVHDSAVLGAGRDGAEETDGRGSSRFQPEAEYRRSVLRDLTVLLNTRNPFFDLSADFVEVPKSGLSYGLPDVTSLKVGNPADQQRLRQAVELALRRFEPRLKQVSVTVAKPSAGEGHVRLRVEAQLDLAPTSEPVSFDIVMPVSGRRYQVTEAD